ncbi:MAG: histidine phosphatase family protein [Candidatus Binatia bacterium]
MVFLVRHAERFFEPADDPPLTPVGQARSQALAAALSDSGVTAIITTQPRRARDTAAPLAKILGIKPEVVPIGDDAAAYWKATAAAVRRHKDETVLVVGHVTVTGVIAALGGPRLQEICTNVFSDLFVFIPALGEQGLTRLRYGAVEDISRACK